jgi:hypothetical protein
MRVCVLYPLCLMIERVVDILLLILVLILLVIIIT